MLLTARSANATPPTRRACEASSRARRALSCYMMLMTNQQERELLARIAAEPGKMGGKPVIRGRRVTPAMVLKMLAAGATRGEILEAYPVLEDADIDACLLYAARIADTAIVPAE